MTQGKHNYRIADFDTHQRIFHQVNACLFTLVCISVSKTLLCFFSFSFSVIVMKRLAITMCAHGIFNSVAVLNRTYHLNYIHIVSITY